jgi:hypothetical protein
LIAVVSGGGSRVRDPALEHLRLGDYWVSKGEYVAASGEYRAASELGLRYAGVYEARTLLMFVAGDTNRPVIERARSVLEAARDAGETGAQGVLEQYWFTIYGTNRMVPAYPQPIPKPLDAPAPAKP